MTSVQHITALPTQSKSASFAPRTMVSPDSPWMFSEESFTHALYVERKRSERSGKTFVLMLLEATELLRPARPGHLLDRVLFAVSNSSRDTDTVGWYREGSIIGVIYTEPGANEPRSIVSALRMKVTRTLAGTLSLSQMNEVRLSFHVFPDDWEESTAEDHRDRPLFDEWLHDSPPRRMPQLAKRALDVSVSLLGLVLGLPLFVAIAAAIRLTSKGPALFSQRRVGYRGSNFSLLKFRSMYVNNDPAVHEEFTADFIANRNGAGVDSEGATYKITADPRVTRIGRFLRRSSLDELPQLLNVLRGEMSLVGPRPPVPYEVGLYDVWHRSRLLAAKPGITGLWQVCGRSRVKFDDMVRMDLRYAASWSLWLDIRILLQTPRAVLSGEGAY